MANTYSFQEALSILAPQIGRNLEEFYAAYLISIAQNVIWNRYDWRETIALLPPFWLVPHTQDYGAPAVIIPSDFGGLRETYLVNPFTDPAKRIELKPRRDIRLTNIEALPELIGYDPAVKKFRIYPRVPGGIGAADWLVDGTYKKVPTKITPGLLTQKIPWDDQYFQVFLAALKWAAWDTAGDPRAGKIQESAGQYVYSGQLGVMHDLIDQMASNEGLNLGDPVLAPAEPLVYPPMYGYTIPGLGSF